MVKMLGSFEDIGEAAAEAGQNIANQAKQQAKNVAQTAAGQIAGNQSLNQPQNQQGTNEQSQAAPNSQMSDDQAKQFLKDLYGPSTPKDRNTGLTPPNNVDPAKQEQKQPTEQGIISQSLGLSVEDPNKGKTPQEIAEIQSLKNQLHAQYYQDLTRPKPQEERVAEKLEREDEEKQMEELQKQDKEEKSKLPATQKVGTGESVVGVAG